MWSTTSHTDMGAGARIPRRQMRARTRGAAARLIGFLAALLTALACSAGSDSTDSFGAVAGTYVLTTVDTASLPVVLQSSGTTALTMTAAQLVLGPDGSAQHIVTSYATSGGVQSQVVTDTGTGTYSATATSVILSLGTAAPDTLTLAGSTSTSTLTWMMQAVFSGATALHAFHYVKQ